MIAVQAIIDRVADLLLDTNRNDDEARWTNGELIRWINDSRMAIITRKPSALSKTESIQLVDGTKQSIPDTGVQLFDVVRNMGANGLTAGRSIRRTDRQNIDDDDMYWHSATKSNEISQFTYDDRSPKTFYVSPPALEGTQIEIVYANIPPEITSTTDSLDVGLETLDAIINYVAYRAKAKDSEYANASEAAGFYSAFADSLGVQTQTQAASSPNQPGNSV